ncbi:hypothetical protein K438DRAFT_1955368 [Mycena galopus ATCC 62051]|nr:hypothetical protein K438DRAFT_1955368 [Mycena galopus ATCC 62051]
MAVVTGRLPEDPDTSLIGSFNMATMIAALLGGEVYVAETVHTGKIIGCAVWFGPGRTSFDSPDQQKLLTPLSASLGKEQQDWWRNTFIPKYEVFVASTVGAATKLAALHLQLLAVDPAYQGRGIARLLVNVVAEKARAVQPPVALSVHCGNETT